MILFPAWHRWNHRNLCFADYIMTFGLAQMEPRELVPYRRYRALGAVYVTLNLLFIFLLIALQELLDNKEKAKDFGEHDDVVRLLCRTQLRQGPCWSITGISLTTSHEVHGAAHAPG